MNDMTMENDEPSWTMYVVSVSGPRMSGNRQEKKLWMDRLEVHSQLYQVITVDWDELRYRAHTPTGEVFDAFYLNKRPGKVNEIRDLFRYYEDWRVVSMLLDGER